MAMKVFSFKQSICFLEPEVKNGAKHTFDNESFGVLPCFFKLLDWTYAVVGEADIGD